MYYIEFENKIVLADDNLERLRITLQCRPEYEGVEIKETERPLVQGDGEYIYADTPEYEEEQKQKERERIGEISMTRGDVFEALILAKGVNKNQIRHIIESKEGLSDIERTLYLNRFDEALNFYRKYPVIDLIAEEIGITPEQLDKFFITGDYKQLCE